MTLAQLVRGMAEEAQLEPQQVRAVLDALAAQLEGPVLTWGESVRVPRLGTFYPRRRAARPVRNPVTGERMDLPALTDVGFRPARNLKRKDVAQ